MAFATHPPETDLILPLPDGDQWDPHTIHTHYFGFSIPESEIGAFIYIRYMPYFPLCQGGVCIFQGTENVAPIDIAFLDFEITMPWPTIDGATIQTANGLRIEFLEPGSAARITYTSRDGETSFDVTQTAVTPLLARGHIVPGEEDHHSPGRAAGGSEQFMHCTGELILRGERHGIDCHAARDRSWRQVRVEDQGGAARIPPLGWSPMYFGPDLVFNQISWEHPDTTPSWEGVFDLPADQPTHFFGWVHRNGETREIVRVHRNVLEFHPEIYVATRQEIEAEDDEGRIYRFKGEAIAAASLPAWPNASFHDSVYRWEDEQGRVAHCTYQELWADRYQLAMKARRVGSGLTRLRAACAERPAAARNSS
jgi:hypothetical protein